MNAMNKSDMGAAAPDLFSRMERTAEAEIPTPDGVFSMILFKELATGLEHVVLKMGDLQTGPALIRIHSECMTGDVFGSLRCDCGDQLAFARARIGEDGAGAILYLRQEGRGIGLANKLRAYGLQDQGFDTVEANIRLGFAADLRSFEPAVAILQHLGVSAVRLMTNNPRKQATLESLGVTVAERIPVRSAERPENSRYLSAKAAKLGHHIDWLGDGVKQTQGQF